MAKLQAATVSNQIVRKRKRITPAETVSEAAEISNGTPLTSTTTVPTKTHDGGKKPRRAPNTKATNAKPPLLRRNSSTLVESTIPWPAHFTKLAQTHRALNLVYTFCCTRKHLATTFETIKKAVEGHIKRELLIEDVAQIKALVPRAVNFAYVDEALLQVAVLGEENENKSGKAKEFRSSDSSRGVEEGRQREKKGKELLLFEFIDGDLKRQVTHAKTGEPTKPFRKLREEDLKMPVFSQKQMMKLIEKRNAKFTSAVNAFLNQCAADGVDAVEAIQREEKPFVPIPSDSRGTSPAPEQRANLPVSIPKERKTVAEILTEIKTMEWYTGQIVPDGHRVFDPQQPIFGDLNFQLSQNMVNALYNTRGITQLYSHQAEAINNLYEGHNVIVATSTSSGKSLIYQIPMLHQLEQDPNSRGMYIFPTKALAQDQRRSMKELLRFMEGLENVVVETFDGDTPMSDRNLIRDEGRIIFTNPDMLHITILPQEDKWRTFLQNLKFVVVDELHVYNGLFGSHVAFIMRRLRRICAAVGNRHVKFISCSATVANPEEHMKTIFGVDNVKLTDVDGSPSGCKEFVCWNTPFKDPGDPSSGRGDAMAESARLFCQLILRGVRVIAFCRIRKQCEVLITAVRHELTSLERTEVIGRVMGYRGGYAPQDRRKIEKEMFEGKLMGIIATNALELGIDIGSLDAVLTIGFPYTIANLRQQSGRAGRRNKDSLSVLVGDCFPTDQYYMENPDEIFTRPNCELQVDLQNMLVLEGHVQCAAFEMPIRPDEDKAYFGKQLREVAEERMVKDPLGFYHCNERFRPYPSKYVAIRDTEDGHFAVVDITNGRNIVLEEVEPSRAFFTIYEGGIFLHQGYTYLVKEFSPERKIAKVELVKVDWTTQQRDYTDIDPIETEAIRRIPNSLSRAFYGAIKVRAVIFGFFKVDKKRRILDAVEVDNPPIEIFSKGMWLDVPKQALEILNSRRLNVAGAIHAAEHAILSLMPNFVISMPGDVRTECKNAIKELAKKETSRKRPARLTFYDAKGGAGGSGISTKAFEFIDLLLRQACERVAACHCHEGCVECVCSERCREQNVVMSKAGSEVILKSLLNLHIDVDALPWGPEEQTPAGIETVVAATEIRPARGKRIEVVEIKREEGGTRRVVIDEVEGVLEEEEVLPLFLSSTNKRGGQDLTGDQTSNTITVIKPLTVVNSHGLGFSLDGKYINSVATTTNTLTVIRTLDNSIVSRTSVDRASHEGFFAHDNRTIWVACRGTKFVDIVDGLKGGVIGRIETPTEGPSKVLFSPDGQTAYVNHILSPTVDIIDVQQRKVIDTITGLADKFSSDMMLSADGATLWVAHKKAGKTTVIDLRTRTIVNVLETGPETNHPNFAIINGTLHGFVTSAAMNATMVYRQDSASSIPVLVRSVRASGVEPHGIWGSPDNSRMYTVNEHSDTVDVIDTQSLTVIHTMKVGQESQALVYVAGAVPSGNDTENLTREGLDKRIENRVVAVTNSTKATALFTIRELVGLDMFQIIGRTLEINQTYVARAVCKTCNGGAVPIVEFNADMPEVGHMGCAVVPQVMSFLRFFDVYDVDSITLQLKAA